MRIKDLDKPLMETIPTLATPAPTVGGAPAPAAQSTTGAPQPAAGQPVDPATAMLAKQQQNEKKQAIQDQIKATEKQLQDLRKQLAQIK